MFIYTYIYICFSNTPWWMVYGCLWHPHPRPVAAMLADRRCFATWDEPVAYPEKWRNGDPTCSIETICHSSCFQWKLWKHMEAKEQHSAAENGASSDCCCNVLVLSLSRLASLPIGCWKLKTGDKWILFQLNYIYNSWILLCCGMRSAMAFL